MMPFTRVQVAGRGLGVLSVENDDGTWDVEFDDDTEGNFAAAELSVCEDSQIRDEMGGSRGRSSRRPGQAAKFLAAELRTAKAMLRRCPETQPETKDQCMESLLATAPRQIDVPSGIRVVNDPEVEQKPEGWMRFVCFSDTHGLHDQIPVENRPAGDVLLHAGDFTNTGELEQIESFSVWLEAYPAKRKIVIAGNHDITLDETYYQDRGALRFHRNSPYDCKKARGLLERSCTYLEDSAAEVCGYTVYGSPWQPEFCDWAFNLPVGQALREKWSQIPSCVDILVTHGPPQGFGDNTNSGLRAGCQELRLAIEQRQVSVHLSGHIHEGYGCRSDSVTLYVNASTCTHNYRPTNAPIVFDVPPPDVLRERTQQAAATRETKSHRAESTARQQGASVGASGADCV